MSLRSVLPLAFAAVVCATQASAQQPTKSTAAPATPAPVKKPVKAVAKPAAQPAPSGLVVVKDPVTGELRQANADEIAALSNAPATGTDGSALSINAARRTATPPQAIRGAGGMRGMRLGEDSMSYSVVTLTPDGKLAEACVTSEAAATALVNTGVTPKPAKAKEVLDDK